MSGLPVPVARPGGSAVPVPACVAGRHSGGRGRWVLCRGRLRGGSRGELRRPDDAVAPAPGPHVEFAATAPSAGTYRLFLDFRHGDAVHTAAFTVQVTGTAADEPTGHGHGG